jgi:hypothetical protein
MTEAKFHNISQYIDPKYEKYELYFRTPRHTYDLKHQIIIELRLQQRTPDTSETS